ncbi:hypothetical protein D3C73_1320610 [compost metagenome]
MNQRGRKRGHVLLHQKDIADRNRRGQDNRGVAIPEIKHIHNQNIERNQRNLRRDHHCAEQHPENRVASGKFQFGKSIPREGSEKYIGDRKNRRNQ